MLGSDWSNDYILKREHNNYNLCVLGENNTVLLVIENKVKSLHRHRSHFCHNSRHKIS